MSKAFAALRAEWYGRADALARTRGDRDIETPKGDLRGNGRKIEGKGVGAREFHAHCEEDGSFELATAKRRFLHAHAFASPFERTVWEMHVEGVSARETARRMGKNRKTVDRAMVRLSAAFEKRDAPRRGRPVDDGSLRSEGVALHVRLDSAATLASDHIRAALSVTAQDAIRMALVYYARRGVSS